MASSKPKRVFETLTVKEGKSQDYRDSVVRLYHSHRPANCGVGQIAKITHNQQRVLLRIEAKDSRLGEIVLPGSALQTLRLTRNQAAELEIDKANLIEETLWALNDVNPTNRIATRIALLSVILGFVSVLISMI